MIAINPKAQKSSWTGWLAWLGLVPVLLAGLLILALVTPDPWVKILIEKRIPVLSGLSLHIHELGIDLLRGTLQARHVQIYPPAQFPREVMVDIPEISAVYQFDYTDLRQGRFHLTEARIHLSDFLIVKNQQNILTFQAVGAFRRERIQRLRNEGIEPKFLKIPTDRLLLRIDRIIYKDYSRKPPLVQAFTVNLHEEFVNLPNLDVGKLCQIILAKAILKTSIHTVLHIDVENLRFVLSATLHSARSITAGTVKKTTGILTEIADLLWLPSHLKNK